MTSAISSGWAKRLSACPSIRSCTSNAPRTAAFRTIGVSTYPGATALTRIPCSAHSTASVLVNDPIPAFATAYGRRPGHAKSLATELMLTMEPPVLAEIIAVATA